MPIRFMIKILLLIPLLVMCTNAVAEAPGQAAYQSACAACHGQQGEGNPALNSPALAAQSAAYTERQLSNYANGLRGADKRDVLGKQMVGMAATQSAESWAEIASYLSAMSAVPVAAVDGDLTQGNKYYQSYCGSCHGADGGGNDLLNSPRLTGQHADYLRRQYQNYLDGIRGQHPDDKFGRQMAAIAAGLQDPEIIDSVIAYIVSLQ